MRELDSQAYTDCTGWALSLLTHLVCRRTGHHYELGGGRRLGLQEKRR